MMTSMSVDLLSKSWALAKAKGKTRYTKSLQSAHTPFWLLSEILGSMHFSNASTFLVLFNPEAVLVLVFIFNIDPANITFLSDSEDKNSLFQNDRLRALSIINIPANLKESIKIMKTVKRKFDVIVGNPPYSIRDHETKQKNPKPIFQLFFNLAIDRLNPNGAIAWIQPDTWRTSYATKSDFKLMREYVEQNLVEIHLSQYPWPNDVASVIVDWFVCGPRKDNIQIVSAAGTNSVEKLSISDLNVTLKAEEPHFLAKVLSSTNRFTFNKSGYAPNQGVNPRASKNKDDRFKYPVACAGHMKIEDINMWSSIKERLQDDNKVVVSLIRALRPTIDNGVVGLGSDSGAICASDDEAKFIVELLNSDPIQAVLALHGDSPYTKTGMNAGKRNRAAKWLSRVKIDYAHWQKCNGNVIEYFGLSDDDVNDISKLLNT